MKRLVWLCPLVLACSSDGSYASEKGAYADTGGDGESADDNDTAVGFSEPAYWSMDAVLSLSEGELQEASLQASVLDQDLETLCAQTYAVEASSAEEVPHESVISWWELSPGEGEGDCADTALPLPAPLWIGVGALVADLEALLGPAELDTASESLNGAYASFDAGQTLYVYGVAGTDAAFEGSIEPATEAPLADGSWTLVPLFTFPLVD
jgi:hypothetical protein